MARKLIKLWIISALVLWYAIPSIGFTQIRNVQIYGQVRLAPQGVPIVNARVVLLRIVPTAHSLVSSKFSKMSETLTGKDGSYTFEVPLDNYMIELEMKPCSWSSERYPLPKKSFKKNNHIKVNISTNIDVIFCGTPRPRELK